MDECAGGPRSLPFWDWLHLMYLSLCEGDTEKPREDHFLPSGLFMPTPWPVLWLLWSRGVAMAACRGQATSPGPPAAPAELVQGSVAGPGPSQTSRHLPHGTVWSRLEGLAPRPTLTLLTGSGSPQSPSWHVWGVL